MGLTFINVSVGNPSNGGRTEEVSCAVLRALDIEPHSSRDFVLADGQIVRRRLATATFEYEGRRGDSMVIVGEPGDDPLLGATTLEGCELRPMKLPLKAVPALSTAFWRL